MLNGLWLFLAVGLLPGVAAAPVTALVNDKATLLTVVTALLVTLDADTFGADDEDEATEEPPRKPTGRTHKCVHQTFKELGPTHQRRAHWMPEESFWKPHGMPHPHFKGGRRQKKEDSEKKNDLNGAANGVLPMTLRLSAALRCCAGGDPLDISLVHGVSHTEVFNSVWIMVSAIDACPELDIAFPRDHEKRRETAQGFQDCSQADFDCCVGDIDVMLVWLEKVHKAQCEKAQCDQTKFFCGRKHKHGVDLQGTCDHHTRFLDVGMSHPASTSDCLTFSTCELKKQSETEGFLAEGLCSFGDNAHPHRSHMCAPFKGVRGGSQDDHNFCHSQVRTKIECAFGVLVDQWGILRKPLSATIVLKKVGCLVLALCKLHNFCVDERIKIQNHGREDEGANAQDCPEPLAQDSVNIAIAGGVPLEASRQHPELNDTSPEQLSHGGEHFDDVPRAARQRADRAAHNNIEGPLPRERLLSIIVKETVSSAIAKSMAKAQIQVTWSLTRKQT